MTALKIVAGYARFAAITLVAAVALATLSVPVSASAGGPTIEELRFEVVDEPMVTCFAGSPGAFTILSSYVFDARAIVFAGTVEEPVHVLFHAALTGTLTNAVTGATLSDKAHNSHRYDAERGTHTIAGIEYLTTVPGQGVVVADVGLLEYGLTDDGEVLLAAHGPHDVLGFAGGVEAFCPHLA